LTALALALGAAGFVVAGRAAQAAEKEAPAAAKAASVDSHAAEIVRRMAERIAPARRPA
jgi:hypothetical protein